MDKKPADIDQIIAELEQMGSEPANDKANRHFADIHASQTAELLKELKLWREQAEEKRSLGGRVIVEGFDHEDMKAAFAQALNKASSFFDAHHDIAISVLGMHKLPKGGFHVMLEVDITPMTHRFNEHPDGLDEELIKEHERSFANMKKAEEAHLKELIHDHFLVTTGSAPHVPDHFLINFKDAELLNHMIEKEFFMAGHKASDETASPQAVIRVVKPDE